MWMCCEISAYFVWNTCEKSMIAVGNVVIAFGHCSIIVGLPGNVWNVCEFCSIMLWNVCKFCLK